MRLLYIYISFFEYFAHKFTILCTFFTTLTIDINFAHRAFRASIGHIVRFARLSGASRVSCVNRACRAMFEYYMHLLRDLYTYCKFIR